jgi:hypothetical protein
MSGILSPGRCAGNPYATSRCARVADGPAWMYLAQGGPVTGAGQIAAVVAFHDVTLLGRAKQLKDCLARVSVILGEPGPAGLIIATAVRTVKPRV